MTQFEYITATQGVGFIPHHVIARNWVMDVVEDPENVLDASDKDVRRYIERHYEGGWDAFLEECC